MVELERTTAITYFNHLQNAGKPIKSFIGKLASCSVRQGFSGPAQTKCCPQSPEWILRMGLAIHQNHLTITAGLFLAVIKRPVVNRGLCIMNNTKAYFEIHSSSFFANHLSLVSTKDFPSGCPFHLLNIIPMNCPHLSLHKPDVLNWLLDASFVGRKGDHTGQKENVLRKDFNKANSRHQKNMHVFSRCSCSTHSF